MNKKEKEILRKTAEHSKGLLSPADMINGVAKRDRKSVENLVVKGYLEEVPQDQTGLKGNTYTLSFYRITEKGLIFFEGWYKKLWFSIKGDLRSILISAITAIIIYFLMEIVSLL